MHAKAPTIIDANGRAVRFCQQCSKLHPVEDFKGGFRSCTASLDKREWSTGAGQLAGMARPRRTGLGGLLADSSFPHARGASPPPSTPLMSAFLNRQCHAGRERRMSGGSPGTARSLASAEPEEWPERGTQRAPANPRTCAAAGGDLRYGSSGGGSSGGEQSSQASPLPQLGPGSNNCAGGADSLGAETGIACSSCGTDGLGAAVGSGAHPAAPPMMAAGQAAGASAAIPVQPAWLGGRYAPPAAQAGWQPSRTDLPLLNLAAGAAGYAAHAVHAAAQFQQPAPVMARDQREHVPLVGSIGPGLPRSWGSSGMASPGVPAQAGPPAAMAASVLGPPGMPAPLQQAQLQQAQAQHWQAQHAQLRHPQAQARHPQTQAQHPSAAAQLDVSDAELELLLSMDPEDLAEAMLGEQAGLPAARLSATVEAAQAVL